VATFPDRHQLTAALLRFVFFLGGRVNDTQWHFEQEMKGCHPEDVRVLFLWMEPRGPLMIKEIAQEIKGVSLSTLTRTLDRLERAGYVARVPNPRDRRSFQVSPTEQGRQVIETFMEHWRTVGTAILEILTPAEQLILVELMGKLQSNWPST